MSEWKEYTGSDEQIVEISNAEHGWVVRWKDGCESHQYYSSDSIEFAKEQCGEFTHYLICNPHPLADMIIRQAQTGQPVWYRSKSNGTTGMCLDNGISIPHAFYAPEYYEYSFTPFDGVSKYV